MDANVTLIIKAANQSTADHRIECDSDWTVLLLKNHLTNTHPSKPSVKEQRLIYSGKLLVDHIILRTALRHPSENNTHIIHLVCSPPRNVTPPTTTSSAATVNPPANMATAASSAPPASAQVGSSSSGPSGTSTNPTPPESTAVSTDSSTDGVRRRFVSPEVPTSTTTTTTIGGPTPYINPGVPQFPQELITAGADPMHQMALMQQMYAQYMTSYMQYMQMGGAVSGMMWPGQMLQPATPMAPPPNPQVTVTTATTDPQELGPRVDNNAQPQPQQQQQDNQPQIRMNAQGGAVDEEDEGGEEGLGRDWLDWVYMASRCAVLLSIVYFYSTPSRFMLVICIAMLLYLYQAGWFRPARRIEAPPAREGNNNNVNRNDNNNQDDRNNNINNNNNNNNLANEVPQARNPDIVDGNADVQNPPTNEASNRVVEDVPARPSFLALSWTFLTTFFTSLIPEQPQIV